MRINIFLVLAFMAFAAFGQTSGPVAPGMKPAQTAMTTPKNEEVAVLRAQVQIMQEYKDDLLTTVYWSLGGVFAIVVLLAGWSWFGAFRIQQAEVKRIHSELSNDIEVWKSGIEDKITSMHELLKVEMVEVINRVVGEKVDSLEKKIKANENSIIQLARKHQLLYATSDVRHWGYKNIPANIFSSHIRVLRVAKLLGDSWEVNNSLGEMTSIALGDRKAIDADDVSTLLPILDSLPPEYEINVGHLKDALRRMP